MTEYSSEREKALVEAAREIQALYGTVKVETFNRKIAAIMVALLAYDPPKPRVPVLPEWEEFVIGKLEVPIYGPKGLTRYDVKLSATGPTISRDQYNAIRDLTSKEAE